MADIRSSIVAEIRTPSPIQITAAELLQALREQPLAVAEAQAKIERERTARHAREYDSWKHLRRLEGVENDLARLPIGWTENPRSYLHQEDTGELDKNGQPI